MYFSQSSFNHLLRCSSKRNSFFHPLFNHNSSRTFSTKSLLSNSHQTSWTSPSLFASISSTPQTFPLKSTNRGTSNVEDSAKQQKSFSLNEHLISLTKNEIPIFKNTTRNQKSSSKKNNTTKSNTKQSPSSKVFVVRLVQNSHQQSRNFSLWRRGNSTDGYQSSNSIVAQLEQNPNWMMWLIIGANIGLTLLVFLSNFEVQPF